MVVAGAVGRCLQRVALKKIGKLSENVFLKVSRFDRLGVRPFVRRGCRSQLRSVLPSIVMQARGAHHLSPWCGRH